MFAAISNFKSGMIQLWSGSIASIPAGWVLCDGNNGTPNLLNRMVMAAGDVYAPDATGGTSGHTHTCDETHTHVLASGANIDKGGTEWLSESAAPLKGGVTGNAAQLPFYYALAYIMKL